MYIKYNKTKKKIENRKVKTKIKKLKIKRKTKNQIKPKQRSMNELNEIKGFYSCNIILVHYILLLFCIYFTIFPCNAWKNCAYHKNMSIYFSCFFRINKCNNYM